MAIITFFTDRSSAGRDIASRVSVARRRIDFTRQTAAASDTVNVCDVPADTIVTAVYAHVITAEGAAGNFDLGDGDDVNGWAVTTDVNATGFTHDTNAAFGVDAGTGGKLYATADTIDLTPSIELDAAVVDVYVISHPASS